MNKIAAGEVVERPASVVKELIENSLDAEASNIEVELKAGGLELIRVSDDGCGMSREDLKACLLPHATSKISSYDDLLNVLSFGFRGEALASMAAVADVEIITRTKDQPFGFKIEGQPGCLSEPREHGAAVGTTVIIRNLFANVPARRKFLRSPATEIRRATEELISQALAKHSVGFKVIVDGHIGLAFSPQDRLQRWREILGEELYRSMETVTGSWGQIEIKGLISKPEALWPRRREQYLFVNGRRIQNRLLNSAVYQALGPALQGRHPIYLIFLSLPPQEVDFNVHPAKREVRFRHEDDIFRFVKTSLEKALFKTETEFLDQSQSSSLQTSRALQGQWSDLSPTEKQSVFELSQSYTVSRQDEEGVRSTGPLVPCWQIHNRYIMAPIKNGLIIIDQHAAHERILYEEVMGKLGGTTSQQLMFPLTVELSSVEMSVFEEYHQIFSQLGFDLKHFGGRTVILEGLPASVSQSEGGDVIFRNILADLAKSKEPALDPIEKLARSYACHGAIKAGQPMTQEEMNRLIDRLFATSSPYLDPHGRPAVIKLTLEDLERRFGRV